MSIGSVKIANPKKPTATEIVVRAMNKVVFDYLTEAASRLFQSGLWLSLVFVSPIFAQSKPNFNELARARTEFERGNFQKAAQIAESGIAEARGRGAQNSVLEGLEILADIGVYFNDEIKADGALKEALEILAQNPAEADGLLVAKIYFHAAMRQKAQQKFAEGRGFCRKILPLAPSKPEIQVISALCFGRVAFSETFDLTAIIYLEKAAQIFEKLPLSAEKADTYRFLALARAAKLDYRNALRETEKFVAATANSRFHFKHRQALFELATLLSATGQTRRGGAVFAEGLRISRGGKDAYQGGKFLTSLMLHALNEKNADKGAEYLAELEKSNVDRAFDFEIKLGKAVIAAFRGQTKEAEKLFAELEQTPNTSEFILPNWKIIVAEYRGEAEKVIELNAELLALLEKNNFKEDLPAVYLNFAKAYAKLEKPREALENLEKCLALLDETRQTENTGLALGIAEIYHQAFRLSAQLKLTAAPPEAFAAADLMKARFLRDKLENSVFNREDIFSPETRRRLETLAEQFTADENAGAEIARIEKSKTLDIPPTNQKPPDLTGLKELSALQNTAIISYFFTGEGKLFAFVAEAGKPLRVIDLQISEKETEEFARTTPEKIKNFIFFKRDGKAIYDKLLKPLGLSAARFIIIPDKSLWKIPFQALSADGEKYLIEEKIISYAPSVSILLDQLRGAKPNRQTLQAFANAGNGKLFLRFVNPEATAVATIYGTKPVIDAKIADFQKNANTTDILHFSMHAKLDGEQPLDSFLAFRESKNQTGRLTVSEILNYKLKKGSLVFLASCETGSVLNGEGLVSLSWAMTAAGATTIISSNWEADDKSTETFTAAFYRFFKQGTPAAVALQKAALELIKNKSNRLHEPYYWAEFSLSGDFR